MRANLPIPVSCTSCGKTYTGAFLYDFVSLQSGRFEKAVRRLQVSMQEDELS